VVNLRKERDGAVGKCWCILQGGRKKQRVVLNHGGGMRKKTGQQKRRRGEGILGKVVESSLGGRFGEWGTFAGAMISMVWDLRGHAMGYRAL